MNEGPASPGRAPGDELVEVVSADGEVIEVVTRARMRAERLRHRTVFIVILDGRGERLLTHRRADWKDVWPSRWDIAFGGVVGAGETWEQAALRELAEEAGVNAPLRWLGSGSYQDAEVAEVAQVFVAHDDGPFVFDDGEVVETAWVGLTQLDHWLAGRLTCPDSIALVRPRLT